MGEDGRVLGRTQGRRRKLEKSTIPLVHLFNSPYCAVLCSVVGWILSSLVNNASQHTVPYCAYRGRHGMVESSCGDGTGIAIFKSIAVLVVANGVVRCRWRVAIWSVA